MSLRVSGEGLDPDTITVLLGREPTHVGLTPTRGTLWLVGMDDLDHLEDGMRKLIDSMTPDLAVWRELNKKYHVDIFAVCFKTLAIEDSA